MSELPVESLKSVVDSLLGHIPEDSSPRILVVKSDIPSQTPRNPSSYDPALVFVLELATILAMRDAQTVEALGKDVANTLQTIIRNASSYHYVVISRAAYYLLSLLHVSDQYDFVRVPVILHAFAKFDQDVLRRSAISLLQGMYDCMKGSSASLRSEMSTSPDFWVILQSLHAVPEASPYVFRILEDLASPPHMSITVDNYEQTITLLNNFASMAAVGANDEQRRDLYARRNAAASAAGGNTKQAKPPKPKHRDEVLRGTKSVALVFQLTNRVPDFIEASHLETTAQAWNAYWSPIFKVLARQCLNPCREVRHPALSALQRALLSKDLASAEHKGWTAIFGEVLFPLITQLLKPEVFQTDPVGMGETRVQAATGLCKIFLHYLVVLADWDGMVELWVKILGIMERLMNSGVGDNLVSTKGLGSRIGTDVFTGGSTSRVHQEHLTVMADSGYLVPPDKQTGSHPQQKVLWEQTWKHLDRFLPQLRRELFPEAPGSQPQSPRRSNSKGKHKATASFSGTPAVTGAPAAASAAASVETTPTKKSAEGVRNGEEEKTKENKKGGGP